MGQAYPAGYPANAREPRPEGRPSRRAGRCVDRVGAPHTTLGRGGTHGEREAGPRARRDRTGRARSHGRGVRLGHRDAAQGGQARRLRPGVRQHRGRQVGHHLHRRRRRHPALPRLPDRAAGREVDVHRGQLPADLRRAADRRAARRRSPTEIQRHTHAARGPASGSSTASRATRTRCRCCLSAVNALSTFYQDSLDPFDHRAGRAVDDPAAGQAADDRGLRLQEVRSGSRSSTRTTR